MSQYSHKSILDICISYIQIKNKICYLKTDIYDIIHDIEVDY